MTVDNWKISIKHTLPESTKLERTPKMCIQGTVQSQGVGEALITSNSGFSSHLCPQQGSVAPCSRKEINAGVPLFVVPPGGGEAGVAIVAVEVSFGVHLREG